MRERDECVALRCVSFRYAAGSAAIWVVLWRADSNPSAVKGK